MGCENLSGKRYKGMVPGVVLRGTKNMQAGSQ